MLVRSRPVDELLAIHRLHLLPVGMVVDAIHQRRDPLGVEFKGRHFLPEALAALPVAAHDLGVDQLTGQQEDQLLFLAGDGIRGPDRPLPLLVAGAIEEVILIPVRRVHSRRPRLAAPALGPGPRRGLPWLQETYRSLRGVAPIARRWF